MICRIKLASKKTLFILIIVLCFYIYQLYKSYSTEFDGDIRRYNYNKDDKTIIADKLYDHVKVLCWVMTYPENHKRKARHVKRTWGKRCNKILFMSTEIDKELESIALPVINDYNNLWPKTKEAFKYIYNNYLNEYDWFLKADDDTYVVVENLRYMLYPYDPKNPLYFGCRFKPHVVQGYNAGGSGYVLSREALKRFIEIGLKDEKYCRLDDKGYEDVEMGKCMEKMGITPSDTRDTKKRVRFFPFSIAGHLTTLSYVDPNYWYWKTEVGLNCCSNYAIAFHYVPPNEMYVLDYLIYYLRPYGIEMKTEPLPSVLILPGNVTSKEKNV